MNRARASTTPLVASRHSGAYVCPDGMNCKRIHNVDNEALRNAIARIANEPVSRKELISFQEKRQMLEEVAMTAKRAAAPYHNSDLGQNKLAVKLAKLYHQFRGENYCLFILARVVVAALGSRILANINPDRGATLPITYNAAPAITTVPNRTGTLTQLTAEPSEAEPDLSCCGTMRGAHHEPVQNHSTAITETETADFRSTRGHVAQYSMVAVERTSVVPVNHTTEPHFCMKSTLTMLAMFGVAVVFLIIYNTD